MSAPLIIVIVAMLIQQAFAYFTTLVLPNMAPVVAVALNIDPHLIGYYTGVLYFFSSMGQISCGGFILRFGAVRMSQVSLTFMGLALMTGYFGALVVFAVLALMAIVYDL